MNTKQIERKLIKTMTQAEELATQYVIQESQRIMKINSELDTFIITMGYAFFTDINRHHIDAYNCDDSMKNLFSFIGEWDSVFHITGAGYKITKDEVITKF